jgi:Uma2 family endonuclease
MNFPRPPATLPHLEPRPKRFSLEEYAELTKIGFFKEDDRIELIRGELIEMAAKGTKHIFCCQELVATLPGLVGQNGIVRCQDPIVVPAGSEPEPDFVVVKPRRDRYRNTKAQADDVLLIIEVADSSIEYDRTYKGSLYAEAGIAHYWIFNVLNTQPNRFRTQTATLATDRSRFIPRTNRSTYLHR